MASFFTALKRIYTAANPPASPPPTSPIKFGILGAANIAPTALVLPVSSHPETIVYAIAARDKTKAETFAKKHSIPKVYSGTSGYQELLDDPEIDAVYNPLPNGLHYEWTMKALAAGKHVLVEKPSSNTADETRQMFELAERKNLVLLEGFHHRFHPALMRVKAILASDELGPIKNISSCLTVPASLANFKKGDIRLDYALGGGAMMNIGCYPLDIARLLTSSNPISVLTAKSTVYPPQSPAQQRIDLGTIATLAFPNDVTATIACDFKPPGWGPFGLFPKSPEMNVKVECERGEVELSNYMAPVLYHWIRVRVKDADGKHKVQERVEKLYKPTDGGVGEEWWSTYRYQMEAFVNRVKGRSTNTWINKDDSVANMEWIEKVYEKTGLGSRPKSEYVYTE